MKKVIFGLLLISIFVVGCAKKDNVVVVDESLNPTLVEYESVDNGLDSYEDLEIIELTPEIEEIIESINVPETTSVLETTKQQETTLPPEIVAIVEETTIPEIVAVVTDDVIIFETTTIPDETLATENEKQYKVGDRKVENGKTYEYFRGPSGFYWEEAVVERDDPEEKDDSVVYNGRDDINDKEDWEDDEE